MLGYVWMLFPDKEIHPFATDMAIGSLWYINLLCYKLRFVLLVGALTINLKGTLRMIGGVFLVFYFLNLVEYMVMYDSPNSIISFIVKSVISLFLITLWNYGKRHYRIISI